MFKLTASNGEVQYDVNEYYCDTPDDVVNLPTHCAMGSKAIIISTGEVYVLNSKKEWKKM